MTVCESSPTGRQALRCLVVEDQTMFLQLLVGVLRTVPGVEVVATAASAGEACSLVRAAPVDLLILDLKLPDASGGEVLRAAVGAAPGVACIVLSSAAAEFACPSDLRGNVRAVIDKTQAYERLQCVIADLVRSRGIGGTEAGDAAVAPASVLRPRELQVLELIGRGFTTADIAGHLGISRNTVETHRRNIVARIGVRGAELVRLATIHNQTRIDAVEPGLGRSRGGV